SRGRGPRRRTKLELERQPERCGHTLVARVVEVRVVIHEARGETPEQILRDRTNEIQPDHIAGIVAHDVGVVVVLPRIEKLAGKVLPKLMREADDDAVRVSIVDRRVGEVVAVVIADEGDGPAAVNE